MASEEGKARGYVWLPTGVVIIALLAPAFLPTVLRWKEQAIARELREVNAARPLAAARRAAFERTISTRAGYQISRNPSLLQRADEWQARYDAAAKALASAAVWLGPEAREELARLDRDDETFRRSRRDRDQRPLSQAEQFRELPGINARAEELLAAYDRLDAALVAEGDKWQRDLDRFGQIGWWTSVALSALGMAAVVTVAGLTRREQRARAAAESAVRTRDELVSIVSHDLRNPLSTVQIAAGYLLEALPEDALRATDRKSLGMIKRAAENMSRMIQDLLDRALIEWAHRAVERTTLALASFMDEATTMLRPLADSQRQRLEATVADGLDSVCADRDRLLQILSNLVGNAVKFTPAGGTITLAAEGVDGGVRFRVSDTGTGIAPEHIPHLFDRFWQAARNDRRGLGLGLPIVKGLVEAHGSRIDVTSAVGKGTTFSFTISRVC
jgi:signal transduction histidine kinase